MAPMAPMEHMAPRGFSGDSMIIQDINRISLPYILKILFSFCGDEVTSPIFIYAMRIAFQDLHT